MPQPIIRRPHGCTRGQPFPSPTTLCDFEGVRPTCSYLGCGSRTPCVEHPYTSPCVPPLSDHGTLVIASAGQKKAEYKSHLSQVAGQMCSLILPPPPPPLVPFDLVGEGGGCVRPLKGLGLSVGRQIMSALRTILRSHHYLSWKGV